MSKQYNKIVIDEVLYWFDILQENTIDNISDITGIHRNKVGEILTINYADHRTQN